MTALARAMRKPGPLPGFGLTLGFSMFWLSLVVLVIVGTFMLKRSGELAP